MMLRSRRRKYYLVYDKNPVHTPEDLQNNFSIEDVLSCYCNKLLHCRIHVRDYKKELEALSPISDTEPM